MPKRKIVRLQDFKTPTRIENKKTLLKNNILRPNVWIITIFGAVLVIPLTFLFNEYYLNARPDFYFRKVYKTPNPYLKNKTFTNYQFVLKNIGHRQDMDIRELVAKFNCPIKIINIGKPLQPRGCALSKISSPNSEAITYKTNSDGIPPQEKFLFSIEIDEKNVMENAYVAAANLPVFEVQQKLSWKDVDYESDNRSLEAIGASQ